MATTATATKRRVPAKTYGVDPVHSSAGFAVVHNGVSTFRGGFGEFEARLRGGEEPRLEGTVEVASIQIEEKMLKGHLLSPEFFDAEQHPRLHFVSTAFEVADDGSLTVRGELEIRGKRRVVEAHGRFGELGEDAYGKARVGISLGATVDRRGFGLDWNAELPSGGQVLDYEVTIAVELELVEEAE